MKGKGKKADSTAGGGAHSRKCSHDSRIWIFGGEHTHTHTVATQSAGTSRRKDGGAPIFPCTRIWRVGSR